MGVGSRESVLPLSDLYGWDLPTFVLGFCGDTRRVHWTYTSGLVRTTTSRYVKLDTSPLVAGAYNLTVCKISGSQIWIHKRNGGYGLYLDDTLLDGSSARCPTFENEPLCSPGTRKGGNVTFECVGLEVWAVGPT